MAKYLDYSGLQDLWAKIKAIVPTKVSDLTNDSGFVSSSGVTSVRVQATSPVASSTSTAQTSTLNTTISLSDAYGDTKNPYSAKTANHVLAGPSSGDAATPTFRALTADDIPTLTKSKISDFPTTWALSNITDADDLKAIEAITGTSGLLKKTDSNTWELDTNTYVTSSGVTSVRVQATSPVVSSSNTAQTSTLDTTISLADAYGDTKNPYGSKTANYVLASPSGSNGAPSFRALVAADIPSITKSKISDFPTTWALENITDADDLKAIEALSGTSGLLKKTAANTWTLDTSSYVTSSGVTSVRVQATSPVVSSVNTAQSSSLNTTISLADAYGDTKNPYGNKNANLVLASPSSGNAAAPSFRSLVAADIPSITKSKISDFPTIPAITLNGTATTSPSFYAPTSVGTDGYVLKSGGNGAPSWVAQSTLSVGSATTATKATQDASGNVITTTYRRLDNDVFDSIDVTELNADQLVVNGVGRFVDGLYGNLTGNVIGTASNATSAASATKATQDGDGNTISSTYLKLSGGTLTGDLTLQKSSTIASNQPSRIVFKTIQTDNNSTYTSAYVAVYDDHDAAANGTNMVIQSGGNVFIGGGESPSALYSNKFTNSTGENTYITADTEIFVQSNCGTIGNRLGFGVNTSGNIIPVKAEAGNNYAQDIGSNSVYWKSLYTRIINQAWTDGTRAQAGGDQGESASPRYLPEKWSFNHGHNPANGDMITIKTPGAGHSYGVYLSMNNGTNYYPITLAGTGRLTTHFGTGTYLLLMFDSSNSATSMYALAGQNDTTTATVTGGTWRVLNYYDTNTNTLLRVYASSTNINVPLIGQSSANSATAAWSTYTGTYKDWYGAIPNDDAKRVKINLSTGVLTVPSGISASSYVSANAANSGTAGGLALYGTSPTSYGIAMRNTTNGGTHGYVTGDWAIYSYMSGGSGSDITGSNNRGWILKNVTRSTNVASISGAGHATFDGSVTTPTIDVTDLTAGKLIVTGVGRFANGIYGDLTGTATQVSNNLTITLNGGTTEGTDKFTYNGSAAKTINIPDTKNTAGSTNSLSKLFLVGATSQAANPQTYSNQWLYYSRGLHSDAWSNSDDETLIDQTAVRILLEVTADDEDFSQKVEITQTGVTIEGSPGAQIQLTDEGTATFTGLVAPTNNSDAANKKYVDDTVATCVVKPTAASTSGVPYTTSSNTTVTWGTLPVGQGGTGQTSWTQYSLVYASASTTLTSLGVGTSGYVLKTNGSSSAPSWVAQSTLSVGTASKLGSSTVGGADRPIYLSSGTATQTTYRMAGTNATATTALAITDNLNTGIWYVNGTNSTDLYSQADGAAFVNKYSDSWIAEIYQDYRTGQIALRGKNNGTWQPWRKVLDSGNYQNFNTYGELNAGNLIVTGSGRFTNGIIGDVTGNLVGTASKATQDADGNTISSTYAKVSNLSLALSGNVIQLKNGNTVVSSITLPVYNGGVS